jgi:hypothetical protein
MREKRAQICVRITDPELSPEAEDVVKVTMPLPCQCGCKKLADFAGHKDGVD